jgi:hypothetical protein
MAEHAELQDLEDDYEPTPWHFKLLLIGLILYLLYRGYQLLEWLVHRLT